MIQAGIESSSIIDTNSSGLNTNVCLSSNHNDGGTSGPSNTSSTSGPSNTSSTSGPSNTSSTSGPSDLERNNARKQAEQVALANLHDALVTEKQNILTHRESEGIRSRVVSLSDCGITFTSQKEAVGDFGHNDAMTGLRKFSPEIFRAGLPSDTNVNKVINFLGEFKAFNNL
jgi:hypothetical protein